MGKRHQDLIEQYIAEGVVNGEEIDITAKKIYNSCIKPFMSYEKNKVEYANILLDELEEKIKALTAINGGKYVYIIEVLEAIRRLKKE